MKTKRLSLAVTFGEVAPPAADQRDRDQLIVALQTAHARDHMLVQQLAAAANQLAEGRAALEHTTRLLQTRTIERDHFQQDGHLWGLCLAYLVSEDDGLVLPVDSVNAMEGFMLSANVEDGRVHITVGERPPASEEGGGNGG